jgi:hypothetical protein
MAEIVVWYRGIAKDVPLANPGEWTHDFGEGLYLTNTEEVAWEYADVRSAGDISKQRVLTANIDRSTLGRVLDLTKDPRWTKYMNEPVVPELPGRTPSSILGFNETKVNRALNEQYDHFFKHFLEKHTVDMNDFDSVIGPELVRGGKQLCILDTHGESVALQSSVRSLLRPVPSSADTMTIEVTSLRFPPVSRVAPVLKTLGASVGMMGFGLLVTYLRAKQDDRTLQEGMKKLEPEINRRLATLAGAIAKIQATGRRPYANITITTSSGTLNVVQPEGAGVISITEPPPCDLELGRGERPQRRKARCTPFRYQLVQHTEARRYPHHLFRGGEPPSAKDGALSGAAVATGMAGRAPQNGGPAGGRRGPGTHGQDDLRTAPSGGIRGDLITRAQPRCLNSA